MHLPNHQISAFIKSIEVCDNGDDKEVEENCQTDSVANNFDPETEVICALK